MIVPRGSSSTETTLTTSRKGPCGSVMLSSPGGDVSTGVGDKSGRAKGSRPAGTAVCVSSSSLKEIGVSLELPLLMRSFHFITSKADDVPSCEYNPPQARPPHATDRINTPGGRCTYKGNSTPHCPDRNAAEATIYARFIPSKTLRNAFRVARKLA